MKQTQFDKQYKLISKVLDGIASGYYAVQRLEEHLEEQKKILEDLSKKDKDSFTKEFTSIMARVEFLSMVAIHSELNFINTKNRLVQRLSK